MLTVIELQNEFVAAVLFTYSAAVVLTCSATRAYPTSLLINSNVSPKSGLKGFQNLQQKHIYRFQ